MNRVMQEAVDAGFSVLGLDYSPVKGPEGNIEYLMFLSSAVSPEIADGINAQDVVNRSHEELK